MKYVLVVFISLFSLVITAQYTLTGVVEDHTGASMPGATVVLQGTEYATIADINGEFIFNDIPQGAYTLRTNYVGYTEGLRQISIKENTRIQIALNEGSNQIEVVNIVANHLDKESPFSYEQVTKEELNVKNLGQDLPFLLEHTPSMVVTSDAGAGIGYTGLRLRGSDATRINVTINGVPLNDSESQGVFWVNLPDLASSVESVQIQRGLGASTNGAGAFGGTVAINTNQISAEPFGAVRASLGSFNTRKLTVQGGTGLINDQFSIEGRYSLINSDGYVDRASSDLNSFAISAAKIGENHSLRFNLFSGDERTFQSWWGVPEARVNGDEDALLEHYFNNVGSIYFTEQDSINLFDSDRRYNYYLYDDQVDDYGQDHYQLIYNVQANSRVSLNATAHYTKGRGFFEEFRFQDRLSNYGLSDILGPIDRSNIVRRRWLDNDFYGGLVNVNFIASDRVDILAGGAYNIYRGDHFGEVIQVEGVENFETGDPYYFNDASKSDLSAYAKADIKLGEAFKAYVDLQVRRIDYETQGTDNGDVQIGVDEDFTFFNPKFGLTYNLSTSQALYASFARGSKEPLRSDFVDAIGTTVRPETLNDFEVGYRGTIGRVNLEANLYHMDYTDQLVLTGAINDVGGAIRVNVPDSFRQGIEVAAGIAITDKLYWNANVALSRNKIQEFDDVIVDFIAFVPISTTLEDTDISFSPNVISGSTLTYTPIKGLQLSWLSKYVGSQFLDNTQDESKALDSYWVNDIVGQYTIPNKWTKNLSLKVVVNNIFSTRYASNGYTYKFLLGDDLFTENFLYPQAERNFLVGLDFRF